MSINGNFDEYYQQLEGYTITEFLGVDEDPSGGDGFPQFKLEKEGWPMLLIEVSRDPEGNSGGFLFITDPDELCRCHGYPLDKCPHQGSNK
jgi:hypothetical protein